MGPCASESQLNMVLFLYRKGVEEGAALLIGEKRAEEGPQANGFLCRTYDF